MREALAAILGTCAQGLSPANISKLMGLLGKSLFADFAAFFEKN